MTFSPFRHPAMLGPDRDDAEASMVRSVLADEKCLAIHALAAPIHVPPGQK